MSSLKGVRLKLGRAREQRYLIQTEIRSVWDEEHHRPKSYINSNCGDQVWYVPGRVPPPPDSLSLLVGECLYNFRSSLDHLAWELDRSPGKHTMFPLARCEEEFRLNRLRGMSDLAIAMIVNTQPCYGVNRVANTWLWALETFMNIDKHRHLNLMMGSIGDVTLWDPPSSPHFLLEGPMDHDTVVAIFPADGMVSQFGISPTVHFRDAWEVGYRQSLLQTLIGIDTILAYLYNDFRAAFFPAAPVWPLPER
ncbi:MAG: hypothetical protein WD557_04465 [Dehalococcoidia bacterium]